MTETLFPHFEVKFASAGEGTFEGYASTWGGVDHVGDTITKGAFSEALNEHRRAGTKPAMLWSHDQSQPIGTWTSIQEDAKGLLVAGKLTLGTARGKEAHALLLDDALALSIGFTLLPDGARQRGSIREIVKVHRLPEISLVALPANPQAKVTQVKAAPDTPRALERFLRDVGGFSARQSKALVAGGWRGLNARDERNTIDDVLTRIDALKRSLEEIRNEH